MQKANKKTIIIIAAMLAFSAILFIVLKLLNPQSGQTNIVVISVSGAEYQQIKLTEPQEIRIENGSRINIVEVTAEGVCMKKANCPDQNCVKQGYILASDPNSVLKKIICLPNQVILDLTDVGESTLPLADVIVQ